MNVTSVRWQKSHDNTELNNEHCVIPYATRLPITLRHIANLYTWLLYFTLNKITPSQAWLILGRLTTLICSQSHRPTELTTLCQMGNKNLSGAGECRNNQKMANKMVLGTLLNWRQQGTESNWMKCHCWQHRLLLLPRCGRRARAPPVSPSPSTTLPCWRRQAASPSGCSAAQSRRGSPCCWSHLPAAVSDSRAAPELPAVPARDK